MFARVGSVKHVYVVGVRGHAGPETAIATTYLIVWIPPAGDSLPCAGGTAADKAGS